MWYMNEERQLLQKTIRSFTQNEIIPFIPQMEADEYPRDILRKLGQIGVLGLCIDEAYGGLGADWINMGLALEEIARESNTTALLTALASEFTVGDICSLCSEEQIEKYIKPAVAGDILLGLWSTEPCGAGNKAEIKTTAVLENDQWVINGGKIFSTNAGICDYAVVVCRTNANPDPVTMRGWSYILVPANTPGFTVGHKEHKLGWKGSSTCQVYFNNCRVPKENLIGPLDDYSNHSQAALLKSYCLYGAMALGSCLGVFEKTKKFLQSRMQQGSSLWDAHESIRYEMAQIWSEIECFRGSVYSCLESRNQGENIASQALSIKIVGAKLFESVVSRCIVLFGGTGTIFETDIERYYRDAKMTYVGCGSNNTMTNVLSHFI